MRPARMKTSRSDTLRANLNSAGSKASSVRACPVAAAVSRFFTSVGASITLRPTLKCGNRLKP